VGTGELEKGKKLVTNRGREKKKLGGGGGEGGGVERQKKGSNKETDGVQSTRPSTTTKVNRK